MLKFDANLSFLFNELPLLERLGAAANAGFAGVEYLSPYEEEKDQIADLLATHKLTQVLFNLPAGDWDSGERGIGCFPDRIGEFRDGVGTAIEYAKALGCGQMNCLAGVPPQDADRDVLWSTLVDNVRFAAGELKKSGIRLVIEPINPFDMPGFFINRAEQVAALIEDSGSDNAYIQFDIYHQQRVSGELIATFQKYLAQINHIQVADNPGRHEPGTGEIAYGNVFRAIADSDYDGWIGCEYAPSRSGPDAFSWIKELGA